MAEQISIEDAQDMIMDAFNERATVVGRKYVTSPSTRQTCDAPPPPPSTTCWSQLEREELEAKASFMTALAARGGN